MKHCTLYINLYICGLPRVRVWSFTQLTRMIVAQSQHGNDQSTQVNFVHSSSPLHDLLATPTSTAVNTTLNKSRSFQVWNMCTCSGLGIGHLKMQCLLHIHNVSSFSRMQVFHAKKYFIFENYTVFNN